MTIKQFLPYILVGKSEKLRRKNFLKIVAKLLMLGKYYISQGFQINYQSNCRNFRIKFKFKEIQKKLIFTARNEKKYVFIFFCTNFSLKIKSKNFQIIAGHLLGYKFLSVRILAAYRLEISLHSKTLKNQITGVIKFPKAIRAYIETKFRFKIFYLIYIYIYRKQLYK